MGEIPLGQYSCKRRGKRNVWERNECSEDVCRQDTLACMFLFLGVAVVKFGSSASVFMEPTHVLSKREGGSY